MIPSVKSVLLVDDDSATNFYNKLLLSKLGNDIDINISLNGEEALSHLNQLLATNQDAPDLILLDLNMPIMNGWTFLDELKSIPNLIANQTKIIILSTTSEEEEIKKSDTYSIVKGMLAKPLNIEKLKELL